MRTTPREEAGRAGEDHPGVGGGGGREDHPGVGGGEGVTGRASVFRAGGRRARRSQVALPLAVRVPEPRPHSCWRPDPQCTVASAVPVSLLQVGSQPSREACGPPAPASVLTEHSWRVTLPTLGLCVPLPWAEVLSEASDEWGCPSKASSAMSRGPGVGGAGRPGPEVPGCALPVPMVSRGLGKVAALLCPGAFVWEGVRVFLFCTEGMGRRHS